MSFFFSAKTDNEQNSADNDTDIRKVEDREIDRLELDIVHNFFYPYSVDKVADTACKHHSQRHKLQL